MLFQYAKVSVYMYSYMGVSSLYLMTLSFLCAGYPLCVTSLTQCSLGPLFYVWTNSPTVFVFDPNHLNNSFTEMLVILLKHTVCLPCGTAYSLIIVVY